jgi:non-homologous end joining protein Ku
MDTVLVFSALHQEIHYYQNAIVATTLRYRNEVTDPSHFPEMKDLPEVGEE